MHRKTSLLLCSLLSVCSMTALSAVVERSGASMGRDYARFAGEPVKSIRYTALRSFAPVNREQVVLFTRANEAWLLDLAGPCRNVQTAVSVSVSNFGQRIFSGSDRLQVGRQQCRITQIRSVDLQARRAAGAVGTNVADSI